MLRKSTVALMTTLLVACASTPDSRIEKSPATFAGLSPEEQQKVRAGQISIGFDTAATELALGKPDRVVEQTTEQGATEIWQYLDVYSYPFSDGPCYGAYFRYSLPRYCGFSGVYGRTYEQVSERMRVGFRDGKVVSISREKK